jgi:uncharacterized protein (DUF169 family)
VHAKSDHVATHAVANGCVRSCKGAAAVAGVAALEGKVCTRGTEVRERKGASAVETGQASVDRPPKLKGTAVAAAVAAEGNVRARERGGREGIP